MGKEVRKRLFNDGGGDRSTVMSTVSLPDPAMTRHSVELGLQRVAEWETHQHFGTLRARKYYRDLPTDSYKHRRRLHNHDDSTPSKEEATENKTQGWTLPVILGFALFTLVTIALVAMGCQVSALRAQTRRLDVDQAEIEAGFRHRLQAERRRSARHLVDHRVKVAQLASELRRVKREQARLATRLAGPPRVPDQAAALLGGEVEDTPLTKGFPTRGPAHLLQPANEVGECWGFEGTQGAAVIRLAGPVAVTSVALVHLGRSLAAPKDFSVHGLAEGRLFLLGSFRYDLHGEERQEFPAANHSRTFERVRFEVTSNHGYKNTCVYRFQVFGPVEGGVPTL